MMMIFSFASATGEHMFCENNEELFFFNLRNRCVLGEVLWGNKKHESEIRTYIYIFL